MSAAVPSTMSTVTATDAATVLNASTNSIIPTVFSTPVVPEGYKVMKEGMASILMKGNDVFYNEAQVINRDLSVAVLRHFLPMLEKERADAHAAAVAKGGSVKGAWRDKQHAKKHDTAQKGEEVKEACLDGEAIKAPSNDRPTVEARETRKVIV